MTQKKSKLQSSQIKKILIISLFVVIVASGALFYISYDVQQDLADKDNYILRLIGIVVISVVTLFAGLNETLDLFTKLSGLFTKKKKHGHFLNIPNKPKHYLERSESFSVIKKMLLKEEKSLIGIAGAGIVGLQGMGGIGKSVLAAALAHDKKIRRAFPDGVIWLTFGQAPNILNRQGQLAAVFDELKMDINDIQSGKSYLSSILANRNCLIILDDVWKLEHIEAFTNLGENISVLITTRNAEIIQVVNG